MLVLAPARHSHSVILRWTQRLKFLRTLSFVPKKRILEAQLSLVCVSNMHHSKVALQRGCVDFEAKISGNVKCLLFIQANQPADYLCRYSRTTLVFGVYLQ